MFEMQKEILKFCTEFISDFYGSIPKNINEEFTDFILGLMEKSSVSSDLLPGLSTYEWFRGAYKIVGKLGWD